MSYLKPLDPKQTILIDYTNYRGERRKRWIQPLEGGISFVANRWHPSRAQWLLEAYDYNSNEVRTFALKDIHSWSIPL